MRPDPKSKPSYSPARRWRIALDLILRTVLVFTVVGMVNYLGIKFFHRFHLSSQTQTVLSSRTLTVLRTLTNHVEITLYYDTHAEDNFYSDVVALLGEYRAANKNISVRTVDYVRDPGQAELTKTRYRKYFTSNSDKDLVIFDYAGRVQVFPGTALVNRKTKLSGAHPSQTDPSKPELDFTRDPVSFNGELAFTSRLLSLANPVPLKAYFMQQHGEPLLDDSKDDVGYQKFASVLQQNYLTVTNLGYIGNTGVPTDCNLLIIAGSYKPFDESELQQISQYLREGGRLLALLKYQQPGQSTGLEPILQTWGVNVLNDIAVDAEHTKSSGYDIIVDQFGRHPAVDSLSQLQMQIYLPRPVIKLNQTTLPPNPPQVDELFATSAQATLLNDRTEPPHQYPLACAIEQKPVAGVINPRGNTRIIVVGDSIFLGNKLIESGSNRDFLNAAINWLCDRPQLLGGIGPRPITNFRLLITTHQQRQLGWLLLGALPGGVLLLGWFVWLVRRK